MWAETNAADRTRTPQDLTVANAQSDSSDSGAPSQWMLTLSRVMTRR